LFLAVWNRPRRARLFRNLDHQRFNVRGAEIQPDDPRLPSVLGATGNYRDNRNDAAALACFRYTAERIGRNHRVYCLISERTKITLRKDARGYDDRADNFDVQSSSSICPPAIGT
jgi:hypothetical protein